MRQTCVHDLGDAAGQVVRSGSHQAAACASAAASRPRRCWVGTLPEEGRSLQTWSNGDRDKALAESEKRGRIEEVVEEVKIAARTSRMAVEADLDNGVRSSMGDSHKPPVSANQVGT